MASKNFSGVLRDPLGALASNDKYRFTHVSTTGEVIRGSTSYLTIGDDGVYNIDIEYGNVSIESYSELGKRWIAQGTTTINADTVATTLPALLNALVPASEPLLVELQALLADAEGAASDAQVSADRAETAAASSESASSAAVDAANLAASSADSASTSASVAKSSASTASSASTIATTAASEAEASANTASTGATTATDAADRAETAASELFKGTTNDLINGVAPALSVGDLITTNGFYAAGDGGGAQWVKTASTDTPSQTPAQLGDAKFTDAVGNVWDLANGQTVYYNGEDLIYPLGFGEYGEGIYNYTEGVFDYIPSGNTNTILGSFSELSLMTPSEDGESRYVRFICPERANAEYLLQPSGYVALAGDVTFANGRVGALQIDGVANVRWFSSFEDALNREVPLDMTGYGTLSISESISVSNDIDITCSDDSKIVGYDGAGILFAGNNIKLTGINVQGFYDGTELNEDNFSTAFLLVESGTTVDTIEISGCDFTDCRSVIRAAPTRSDTAVDTAIAINKADIHNNKITGCPLAFYARCLFNDVKITKNTVKNCIGASKGLSVFGFYVDGLGSGNELYNDVGDVIFTNNYVNTVVNRNTTGDSTTGNSYECHTLKSSGRRVVVTDNIIVDNTGVNFDCEAIYTKARYVQIKNNILIDAGTNEGAINVKGTSVESDSGNTSPYGEYSQVSGNIIIFTRDEYDNDGETVALNTIGIHHAVTERAFVCDNTIVGSNTADIVMDGVIGSATANNDLHVSRNVSYGCKGTSSIQWRGAFQNTKCNENICDFVQRDGGSFYQIDLLSVAGRGKTNKQNEFKGNQLRLGYNTNNEIGFAHSFIRVDTEHYDYDGLFILDNIIDIKTTSASARPIYLSSQGSPSGIIYNIKVRGNSFYNKDYALGPIYFGVTPASFDYDITYIWESSQNSAGDAMRVYLADDSTIDAEYRVHSSRIDTSGFAQRDTANFLGYASGSVLNTISNVSDEPVGNATGVGITFATASNYLRVRISGEDEQTWHHAIKIKATGY